MNDPGSRITQQLAAMASSSQQERTGLAPTEVTVILSEDTLVLTLLDALTPAEKELARTLEGAAQVQDFHRKLFCVSSQAMRLEIKRIIGREVREASTEIQPPIGAFQHALATGAMVQMFLLSPEVGPYRAVGTDS